MNLYGFVMNSPLVYLDLWGLTPEQCRLLVQDIEAEKRVLARLELMRAYWKPGQGFSDYGLTADASVTGFLSQDFSKHSLTYQFEVKKMEGNFGFTVGVGLGNAVIGGVGVYTFGLHGLFQGTSAIEQYVMTVIAMEELRSRYILNKLEKAFDAICKNPCPSPFGLVLLP